MLPQLTPKERNDILQLQHRIASAECPCDVTLRGRILAISICDFGGLRSWKNVSAALEEILFSAHRPPKWAILQGLFSTVAGVPKTTQQPQRAASPP